MWKKVPEGRTILMILVAALATAGIIFLLFHADSGIEKKNREYLGSFGWQVEENAVDICQMNIPNEFDEVFSAYRDLCKKGGFDLDSYQGKAATRYTYRVSNHKDSQTGLVHANLLVVKGVIVAADICSMEPDGFLQPVNDTEGQLP